jgi:hypothetical protein
VLGMPVMITGLAVGAHREYFSTNPFEQTACHK